MFFFFARKSVDACMPATTTFRGSSPAFLAGKKVSEKEFRRPHHNHLTSIKSEIDCRDDGNVLIAQRISDI
jgi:hypothetical protein